MVNKTVYLLVAGDEGARRLTKRRLWKYDVIRSWHSAGLNIQEAAASADSPFHARDDGQWYAAMDWFHDKGSKLGSPTEAEG
jgi:hypothetical protein